MVDVVSHTRCRYGQERLLLAGEERPSLVEIRVQRLDAEPVPRAEQYSLLRVPDEEREHSPQLTNDLLAQVVVTRDDRFAVAVRVEGRTEVAGQPITQLQVVVDLAVEDQVVAPQVGERLVAPVDVDDRQAAKTDAHVAVAPHAAFIRAAVPHLAQRRLDRRHAARRVLAGRDESDQSAHIGQYSRALMPTADGIAGRAVRSCRPPDELVVAHLTPRRDIGAGGRVVSLDGDRRSDRRVGYRSGEIDDR